MDKFQAIHSFWSGFDIPAYDGQDVPDDAVMPYITYEASTDSIGNMLLQSASIWYRSNSWETISKKADQIAEAIGYGFKIIPVDSPKGYLKITKGTPFAQRMSDPDEQVKRIYINIQAEFLTAY
jgi:hypothetical protein